MRDSIVALGALSRHRSFQQVLYLDKKQRPSQKEIAFLEKVIMRDPVTPTLRRIAEEPGVTYAGLVRAASGAASLPWMHIAHYIRVLGTAVGSQGKAAPSVHAANLLNDTAHILASGGIRQVPQSWAYRTRAREVLTATVVFCREPEEVRKCLDAATKLSADEISYDMDAAVAREVQLAPTVLVAEGFLDASPDGTHTDKQVLAAKRRAFQHAKDRLPSVPSRTVTSDDLTEIRAGLDRDIQTLEKVINGGGTYLDYIQARIPDELQAFGEFRPDLGAKVDRVTWDLVVLTTARRLSFMETGKEPDLEDLVPNYLAGIPQDPFDPDGGTYRTAGPRVYSIGYDGKDNQGLVKAYLFPARDDDFGINGDVVLQVPWEAPNLGGR